MDRPTGQLFNHTQAPASAPDLLGNTKPVHGLALATQTVNDDTALLLTANPAADQRIASHNLIAGDGGFLQGHGVQKVKISFSLFKFGQSTDHDYRVMASATWPTEFEHTPLVAIVLNETNEAVLSDGTFFADGSATAGGVDAISPDIVHVICDAVGVHAWITKNEFASSIGVAAFDAEPLFQNWFGQFQVVATSADPRNPVSDGTFYSDGTVTAGG